MLPECSSCRRRAMDVHSAVAPCYSVQLEHARAAGDSGNSQVEQLCATCQPAWRTPPHCRSSCLGCRCSLLGSSAPVLSACPPLFNVNSALCCLPQASSCHLESSFSPWHGMWGLTRYLWFDSRQRRGCRSCMCIMQIMHVYADHAATLQVHSCTKHFN